MEFPLDTTRRRRGIVVASITLAALGIFQAGRFWLADYRMRSGKIALMLRGAAAVPENGEAWDRIGRFYQFNFEDPDTSRAIAAYQHALREDPNSSYYLIDLSTAYEDLGNYAQAREALDRAEAVYPLSAEVTFAYGNFLMRRQDYSEGYKKVRRAVTSDPKLLPLAISRTWRASEDVNSLLDDALPANVGAYLEALNFLAQINQPDAGLAVWQRLVGLKSPIDLSRTFPFFNVLIASDRAQDASRVWSEALAADGIPDGADANHSLVWDGDFTQDFINGGLGWYRDSPPGVYIGFDSPPPGKRGRSVRLDFNGGVNPDLVAVRQFVPVEPSTTYHFHAYLRTDQITTDSGIRIAISDPYHGAVNILTDGLIGSVPWKPIDVDVSTGPQTHFVLIQLIRHPSLAFENKLSGSAGIADVSLTGPSIGVRQ